MDRPQSNSKQTAISEPSAFIAEGPLYNYVAESVIDALNACSKILCEGSPNPTAIMRTREFMEYLEQVLVLSAETSVPVTMSYHGIYRRLAYFYASTCDVWISGRPVWDEASYSIRIFHHYYVRSMQPAEHMPPGTFYFQDRQRVQPAPLTSDRTARTEAWLSQLVAAEAEPAQDLDGRSRDAKEIETIASIASTSRNANPVRPAVQPTRLARYENWPEITQDFWPRAEDQFWHLVRKHGPATTWYASGEKPAPPASALQTPSFYRNRRLQPTLSTVYEASSAGRSTSASKSSSPAMDTNGKRNLCNNESNLSTATTLSESGPANFSNVDSSSSATRFGSEDSIFSNAESNTLTTPSSV